MLKKLLAAMMLFVLAAGFSNSVFASDVDAILEKGMCLMCHGSEMMISTPFDQLKTRDEYKGLDETGKKSRIENFIRNGVSEGDVPMSSLEELKDMGIVITDDDVAELVGYIYGLNW